MKGHISERHCFLHIDKELPYTDIGLMHKYLCNSPEQYQHFWFDINNLSSLVNCSVCKPLKCTFSNYIFKFWKVISKVKDKRNKQVGNKM